jgi:hypothetical protein
LLKIKKQEANSVENFNNRSIAGKSNSNGALGNAGHNVQAVAAKIPHPQKNAGGWRHKKSHLR